MAVFSVMTAVPVLYSVYQDLTTGKLSNSGNGTESKYWYVFFQIFPKFLSGRYDSITNSGGLPSVYCGGIVLVFLFLYLIQKKRKLLEKFTAVLILFLFLISFWNVSL
ncbi:MAG: YfhO family protein, partial [Lachnospiraceae bacterium]|nr:YfhO family protein [Lachnospiraceae bacterium]